MIRVSSARRRTFLVALPLTIALAAIGGLPAVAATSTPTVTAIDKTSGGSAATRTVTLTGTGFEDASGDPTVEDVTAKGESVVSFTVKSPTTLTFVLGPALNYQPGKATIALETTSGKVVTTAFAFTRTVLTKVDRQMQYAFLHWNDGATSTAAKTYGYLPDNDCANFVSQTLAARGWKQSWQWYNDGPASTKQTTANIDATSTWLSSTALSGWLATRSDLATHLGYRAADRNQVRVGDIVQFNYEGTSAWWDHSAIVSKIVVDANGNQDIYYVAHTLNRTYGGSTQVLAASYTAAVTAYKKAHPKVKSTVGIIGLRIQFWHLNK